MRRAAKWLLGILAVLLLLPIVLVAVVLIALNTAPGQRFLAHKFNAITAGSIVLSGVMAGCRTPRARGASRCPTRTAPGSRSMTWRSTGPRWRCCRAMRISSVSPRAVPS